MIWGGKADGFPAVFAELIGEMRGIEYAPIEFEIADDLAQRRAEVPPGSEMGPGTVATWGRATADTVSAFGFTWEWAGRSSKHIPFDWSGPDERR